MRVGIVGASTLLGRELADVMEETVLAGAEVVLLDEEAVAGQITAIGDEPTVIRRIEETSFRGMDLCFFAGLAEETTKFWQMTRDAGAGVIDLTDSLRSQSGVAVGTPWVNGLGGIDVATIAVVPARALAVMLALVASRCLGLGLTRTSATVLVPASELGQEGLDEMHRQAVSLLSFQAVSKDVFDTQVAFNLVPALGAAAKRTIADEADRVRADYTTARAGLLPELALQMVHAPVFHGYAVSMLLEFAESVSSEAVENALRRGGHLEVVTKAEEPPSTLSTAGQGSVLAQVSADTDRRTWVRMTADNVRLTALHAIACGMEIQRLRPRGKVQ